MGVFDNLFKDDEDYKDDENIFADLMREQEKEKEIANRAEINRRQLHCENADTMGEEKEASWLISRYAQGINLNYDKETGKYFVFMQVDNESEAVLLYVKDLEEAKKLVEKLVLNLQIARTFGKKLEAPDGEKVKFTELRDTILARRVNDESEILIDGKTLETTRNAGNILLEHANIGQDGEKIFKLLDI